MAHKGRLWEVNQDARVFAGQKTWPNYPAKTYTFAVDSWIGAPTGMPTSNIDLEPHAYSGAEIGVEWRSELMIVDAQLVQILLLVFKGETFIEPDYQFQIILNGVRQYADEPWEGFSNDDWEFLGSDLVFPPPTWLGTMKIGFGGRAVAKRW